jgi:hypothetical protein
VVAKFGSLITDGNRYNRELAEYNLKEGKLDFDCMFRSVTAI